jgi:hypothetical protein
MKIKRSHLTRARYISRPRSHSKTAKEGSKQPQKQVQNRPKQPNCPKISSRTLNTYSRLISCSWLLCRRRNKTIMIQHHLQHKNNPRVGKQRLLLLLKIITTTRQPGCLIKSSKTQLRRLKKFKIRLISLDRRWSKSRCPLLSPLGRVSKAKIRLKQAYRCQGIASKPPLNQEQGHPWDNNSQDNRSFRKVERLKKRGYTSHMSRN